MNFFGHALVAQRHELGASANHAARSAITIRPEFVLGAMLPDFASMLRVRPPEASLESVRAGLTFHHRTDDAFHGCRSFLEFSRQASSFLSERGLARGSSRAVAHIGVELLLDAAFARESAANEAYLSALDGGLTPRVASHIHWQTSDGEAQFRHLCHNLRQRGAYRADAPAELLAERLRRILADRPRLAMDDTGQSVVRDWIENARSPIANQAQQLLREVEQRLER